MLAGQLVGNGGGIGPRDTDRLGEGAVLPGHLVGPHADPVADAHVVHIRADGHHGPHAVEAQDERRIRPELGEGQHPAASALPVRGIDTRELDPDQDLASTRRGYRHLGDARTCVRPDAIDDDCAHYRLPSGSCGTPRRITALSPSTTKFVYLRLVMRHPSAVRASSSSYRPHTV
jgi:hypothetical protein